jgi:tetratricopeptide (TPR) repeat protein
MNRILSYLLFIGVVSACGGTKEVSVPTPPQPEFPQAEIAAANDYFLRGIVAFELEDYDEALDLLSMAYLRLPQHAGVNFALADAYLATADIVNAAYYAREAVRIDPTNRFYPLKLAEIHLRNSQPAASIEVLQAALVRFPNDLEMMYLLAATWTETGEYLTSNRMYDRILKKDPEESSIYYQKFRNYSAMNLPDSAAAQMVIIRGIDPSNILAAQTLAQLYQKMQRNGDAIAVYEDILKRHPDNLELKIGLTDVYVNEGEWEKAGALLSQVMDNPEVRAETKSELMQYMLQLYSQKPDNEGLKRMAADLVERFSASQPDNAVAQAIAADFYSMIEDNANALRKIEATLALNPDNANAWRQRIQLLYLAERYDEVISLSEEAETYAPEDAFVRFFTGVAHMMKKDNANAVIWLQRASKSPARAPFRSVVLGTLGDVTYQLNDWEKAKSHYEEALRLNPENEGVLNNYAYYMSEKGERLEDAKKMSERSLRIDPKNPSFLDTYGWIHYLLGDYATALEYISKSLENGSTSAEVLEHKGDVLDKLGRSEEAIRYWNDALKADDTRTYLLDRIREATP